MKLTSSTIARTRRKYGPTFDKFVAILYEEDHAHLTKMDCPKDEYAPEVTTILPRLHTCKSQADVQRVLHEEFAVWFQPLKVGGPELYAKTARRLWMVWVKRGSTVRTV